MVKTINVTFQDDVFQKLQMKKFDLVSKLKTSLSWEEFIMYLASKPIGRWPKK